MLFPSFHLFITVSHLLTTFVLKRNCSVVSRGLFNSFIDSTNITMFYCSIFSWLWRQDLQVDFSLIDEIMVSVLTASLLAVFILGLSFCLF